MNSKKLKDITEYVRNGKSIKNSSDGDGLPITRIETISDSSFNKNKLGYSENDDVGDVGDYWLIDGDILMSHINSPKHLGKSAICRINGEKIIHGMNLLCIRPIKKLVSPAYLNYFFSSKDFNTSIKSISNQSVNQASFSASKLKEIEVPLPTLKKQKEIINKLDCAKRLVNIDGKMNSSYDELVRGTFLEIFGDPIANKKGWEEEKIKNIGKIVLGNTPPKKDPDNYGDEIEWVKTSNIDESSIYPSEAEESLSQKGKELGRVIPEESLIVCCIAGSLSSIGKCAITDREIAINQQINAIVPDTEVVDVNYLYTLLLVGQELIQDASTKSMKGMVSKTRFKEIELMLPPLELQKEFSQIFEKIVDEKRKLITESEKSQELYSSLLQQSFAYE